MPEAIRCSTVEPINQTLINALVGIINRHIDTLVPIKYVKMGLVGGVGDMQHRFIVQKANIPLVKFGDNFAVEDAGFVRISKRRSNPQTVVLFHGTSGTYVYLDPEYNNDSCTQRLLEVSVRQASADFFSQLFICALQDTNVNAAVKDTNPLITHSLGDE